jgi:MFS family permease
MKAIELGAVALFSRRRYLIYLLVFITALINYWDRAVLSMAIPILTREFHMSSVTSGYLLSAFVFTYALAQLPAGMLLDRFGSRQAGAFALALWSAATAMTAAATGVAYLFLTRLLLGLGESVTMPLSARAVREWAPVRERAFAQALVHSGLPVGTAVASVVVGATIGALGWRIAFVLSGLLGLGWAVVWYALFRQPDRSGWLSETERDLILTGRRAKLESATLTHAPVLPRLLRSRTVWGLFLTQGCVNYANYFLLSWLPSYFVHAYGIDITGSGRATGIVYVSAAGLMIALGLVSDRLLRDRPVQSGARRYVIAAIALGGSVIGLTPLVSSHAAQLLMMAVSSGCVLSVFANNVSLANDLLADDRSIGTAVGWIQLGGNLFGLAAPVLTGYIVSITGGYAAAFAVSGAFLLAGALASITMTHRPIEAG